ncbi:flagellar basal body-associated protein FliL [Sulfuricurvum sp.]|uniref:flagellar basal body-associated protein FliL n=1 Tax=Sulfuricurvum sp. TaxID=2025608 RepID=UPI003BAF3E9B
MAEKEKEESSAEEAGKKKSGNMLLIIIIGVLVLILIIGGIVAFLMMGNEEPASSAPAPTEKAASNGSVSANASVTGLDSPSTEVGLMYPLDGFTVNLLSESGRRYLKVEMNLELDGDELSPELDTKKAIFRDIIIRILSSKSLEEISTIKGKEKLKEQIVNELNMRLKDGKVKNIYFTDFVVQ